MGDVTVLRKDVDVNEEDVNNNDDDDDDVNNDEIDENDDDGCEDTFDQKADISTFMSQKGRIIVKRI